MAGFLVVRVLPHPLDPPIRVTRPRPLARACRFAGVVLAALLVLLH